MTIKVTLEKMIYRGDTYWKLENHLYSVRTYTKDRAVEYWKKRHCEHTNEVEIVDSTHTVKIGLN